MLEEMCIYFTSLSLSNELKDACTFWCDQVKMETPDATVRLDK